MSPFAQGSGGRVHPLLPVLPLLLLLRQRRQKVSGPARVSEDREVDERVLEWAEL